MNNLVRNSLGLTLLMLCFSAGTLAQEGLEAALRMCGDMTDENLAMAKAAGYDVDTLCRGINSAKSQSSSIS